MGTAIDFDESDAVFGDLLNITATVRQSADLGVSQAATPSTVHKGQIVQLAFKASNAGPAPSPATFSDKLPSGLTAISAVAQNGNCSLGPVVMCGLSALAPSSSQSIVVNVRATKTGRQTSTATIAGLSTNTDPSSTNNTASAKVLVQSNATCKVPKLVGHSLAEAKKLLKQTHCALGEVTKPSHHHGALVVVSQHPAAGTRKPAGTKVAVKLAHKRAIRAGGPSGASTITPPGRLASWLEHLPYRRGSLVQVQYRPLRIACKRGLSPRHREIAELTPKSIGHQSWASNAGGRAMRGSRQRLHARAPDDRLPVVVLRLSRAQPLSGT